MTKTFMEMLNEFEGNVNVSVPLKLLREYINSSQKIEDLLTDLTYPPAPKNQSEMVEKLINHRDLSHELYNEIKPVLEGRS